MIDHQVIGGRNLKCLACVVLSYVVIEGIMHVIFRVLY